MEKISNIVRGNARITAADVKASTGVRPGALAFGRPMGDSHGAAEPVGETTAMRAASAQAEMNEAKKTHAQDRIVNAMADQFFMGRVRRPQEEAPATAQAEEQIRPEELEEGESENISTQPQGYTPRGSYVDVHV